jgi:hypothetical protein
MSQLYPPENGPRLARETWYVDDVTGRLIPRSRAVRDYYGRVVDFADLDELGRDELNVGFPLRTEQQPQDP